MPELDIDELLSTEAVIAEKTKLTQWRVSRIKKATKGQSDSPFSGKFTTVRLMREWVLAHPDFKAYKVGSSGGGK